MQLWQLLPCCCDLHSGAIVVFVVEEFLEVMVRSPWLLAALKFFGLVEDKFVATMVRSLTPPLTRHFANLGSLLKVLLNVLAALAKLNVKCMATRCQVKLENFMVKCGNGFFGVLL